MAAAALSCPVWSISTEISGSLAKAAAVSFSPAYILGDCP